MSASLAAPLGRFPNRLQEIRICEGLSVVELARLAELSDRTIRDIEKGRRPGKDLTAHKILIGLNRNPKRVRKEEYAFEEVFPPNQPPGF